MIDVSYYADWRNTVVSGAKKREKKLVGKIDKGG